MDSSSVAQAAVLGLLTHHVSTPSPRAGLMGFPSWRVTSLTSPIIKVQQRALHRAYLASGVLMCLKDLPDESCSARAGFRLLMAPAHVHRETGHRDSGSNRLSPEGEGLRSDYTFTVRQVLSEGAACTLSFTLHHTLKAAVVPFCR